MGYFDGNCLGGCGRREKISFFSTPKFWGVFCKNLNFYKKHLANQLLFMNNRRKIRRIFFLIYNSQGRKHIRKKQIFGQISAPKQNLWKSADQFLFVAVP
jgi:hypothetical protein